jgi:hypothetical protein
LLTFNKHFHNSKALCFALLCFSLLCSFFRLYPVGLCGFARLKFNKSGLLEMALARHAGLAQTRLKTVHSDAMRQLSI